MPAQPDDWRRATALLAITTDGIIELTADWTVAYVSDHIHHLVGSDAVGHVLWEVLGDRTGPSFEDGCRHAMETRKAVEFSEHHAASGSCYVFRAVPHGDGLMVSFRDISHEKRQELEVRGSWELMNSILDALPVGVWVMDASGTIIASNPAARRIWGGARYVGIECFGEYVGWHHGTQDRITAEEWPCARAIRDGEAVFDQEADIQAFDGKRKTIRHSAVPLHGPDGEIIGAIAVNQDITVEKETQLALAHAWVEAKRANVARSRMVAALAHDLLQPLLGVRLHLTGLLSDVPPTMAETVRTLIGSLSTVENLVEGLMENAALETGKIQPQMEVVDLGEAVSHLGCELGAIAAAKGLRLLCRGKPQRGLIATTDAILLQRALRNLVTNAIRCTDRGGVLVGVRRRGDHLHIEVWDTGPGIDEAFLDNYLVDAVHAIQSPNGFGIGLQTVKTISRLLGIEISARSMVGKGTVFRLKVPRGE